MPRFEIKVPQRPNIEVPAFRQEQMQEIGQFALQVMKERLATGTDVFDQPAKPLQPRYAERKRKKGKQPIRDIQLTGLTLQAIQIVESDATHVKIGIRGAPQFRKALFNQNLDPWFGLSDRDDERVLNEKVKPIFSANIHEAFK